MLPLRFGDNAVKLPLDVDRPCFPFTFPLFGLSKYYISYPNGTEQKTFARNPFLSLLEQKRVYLQRNCGARTLPDNRFFLVLV